MRCRDTVVTVVLALGLSGATKPSPAMLFLPIVYEASDPEDRLSDARIDFFRWNRSVRAIDYRLSGKNWSSDERSRSEFGGILRVEARPGYQALDALVLYVPDSGVVSWSDNAFKCTSEAAGPRETKIDCISRKYGRHYESLLSEERGFLWFDRECNGPPGICRYSLTTSSGLMSRAMRARLKADRFVHRTGD